MRTTKVVRMKLDNTKRGHVSAAAPHYIRVNQAVKLFGLGRSTIYTLIHSRAIASRLVKTSPHNVSGVRLILVSSLRAFIEASPTSPDKEKAGVA